MALPSVRAVFDAFRNVDWLLSLEEKQAAVLTKLDARLSDLERRVTGLETREEIVVEQAKAAAASAASAVMVASVADLARRVGRLEAGGSRITGINEQ